MTKSSPTPLSKVLDAALEALRTQNASGKSDGIMFSGSAHDTVPRLLLFDPRLSPLERQTWQILQTLINSGGISAFPTYQQLSPLLGSVPCSQASHESVAKALTALRLTRWMSLARRRRDATTGRIMGNLYVLHDSPLTPFEATQLDPEYMSLVSRSVNHSNKGIQRVTLIVLDEVSKDPCIQTQVLPSHLQILISRLEGQTPNDQPSKALSEETFLSGLKSETAQTSVSEAGLECPEIDSLRHPKSARTVKTKALKEIRTTSKPHEVCDLDFPSCFGSLTPSQQSGARVALLPLLPELRQAVLNEWAMRCRDAQVRNPSGYLFGIIKKAQQGHFTAWAARAEPDKPLIRPIEPKRKPKSERDSAVGQAHLDALKGLVRLHRDIS